DSMNFPMLTGISAAQLMAPDQAMRKQIREAVRLSDLMVQRSYQVSELHFDAPDRLVVFTNEFPVALHMGWGNWEDKLSRLGRLMTLWKGHEERLASLDMSFSDQVVARLRRADH
ncbi:MAG TPA: hypothetical protein VNT76_01335, partial [Candidatus Binatus sp.]|nr:hypothetical protein [Candidatus Binatus sp.]